MVFLIGRVAGKCLVTLMSNCTIPIQLNAFATFVTVPVVHKLDIRIQTGSKGTFLHDILLWHPPASCSPPSPSDILPIAPSSWL